MRGRTVARSRAPYNHKAHIPTHYPSSPFSPFLVRTRCRCCTGCSETSSTRRSTSTTWSLPLSTSCQGSSTCATLPPLRALLNATRPALCRSSPCQEACSLVLHHPAAPSPPNSLPCSLLAPSPVGRALRCDDLRALGFRAVMMSGSGTTCFAVGSPAQEVSSARPQPARGASHPPRPQWLRPFPLRPQLCGIPHQTQCTGGSPQRRLHGARPRVPHPINPRRCWRHGSPSSAPSIMSRSSRKPSASADHSVPSPLPNTRGTPLWRECSELYRTLLPRPRPSALTLPCAHPCRPTRAPTLTAGRTIPCGTRSSEAAEADGSLAAGHVSTNVEGSERTRSS